MFRTKWFSFSLALLFGLEIGAAGRARADLVYVTLHNPNVSGSNLFGALDVATGAFNQISSLSLGGFIVSGMGFGTDGQIYATTYKFVSSQGSGEFYKIDPGTGAASDLGALNYVPVGASGGSGVLYGIDGLNNNFFANTPPSPTGALIGTVSFAADGMVAVGPDGFVYATGGGILYKVSTTDASSTAIGDTLQGTNEYAGTYIGNTLYGFNVNGAIQTIDTATAVTETVATASLPGGYSVYSAAFHAAAVPEPGSLVIAAAGGLAFGAYTWRRQRRRD
jgi:hypothetical protein